MFNNSNKTLLITGGAGFIGSNFIPYFLDKYPNYNIVNLDLLTYAGNLENLKECESNPRYKFIKGDICNRELVEFIFKEYDIRGVIHFAAESHVDNSIKDPSVFIQTNVNGTYTLIDTAYKYWMQKPFTCKLDYQDCRFHHISTDEVYGTLSEDPNELFTEQTPYAPNSPYSASKASSDMIIRSYVETFGMNCVITNCSNNYGPKQHDEKLIPTIIRNALKRNPIPIYGDGKNIRDWLYVLDHCKGIDLVYHKGKKGETYNIGGRNERTNLQIANIICEILDKKAPLSSCHKIQNQHTKQQNPPQSKSNLASHPEHDLASHPELDSASHPELDSGSTYKHLITFVEDRAGHDRRYAIDASKIENELGWKANETFDTGIVKTVEWYLGKYGVKTK
jgi:dTDP-glucose 4,6-dehydratase